ncbi:MAG: hypothetical protein NT080_08175 [Spirochaetes bacterium]|nr:hypothetical protein [Spirochaetota bacterium]
MRLATIAASALAAALALGAAPAGAQEETDLAANGLRGPVLKRTETARLYSGAAVSEAETSWLVFNEAGYLSASGSVRADGLPGTAYACGYDASGSALAWVEGFSRKLMRPEGSLDYLRTIVRDSAGRVIETRTRWLDEGSEVVVGNDYDPGGRLVRATTVRDGEVSGWTEYEYDADGRKVLETLRSAEGGVQWMQETEWDDSGRVAFLRNRDARGAPLGSTRCVRDGEGRLLAEVSMDGSGTTTVETLYAYDARGDLVSTDEYNDGGLQRREAMIRDRAGRLVERRVLGGDGKLRYREILAYDARGNAISHEQLTMADDGATVERRRWTVHAYEYR